MNKTYGILIIIRIFYSNKKIVNLFLKNVFNISFDFIIEKFYLSLLYYIRKITSKVLTNTYLRAKLLYNNSSRFFIQLANAAAYLYAIKQTLIAYLIENMKNTDLLSFLLHLALCLVRQSINRNKYT